MNGEDLSDSFKKVPVNNSMIYKIISSLGHTVETATADLVDNSLQFGALNFKFGFYYDKERSFIYFHDDGDGMDKQKLENAMTIGSLQDENKISAHSKFGLGLKIASLNNCGSFQVFTNTKSNEPQSMKMFYNDEKKDLLLTSSTRLPEKLSNIFPDYNIQDKGTLIIWENLNKNKFILNEHAKFFSVASKVQAHLMLIFHRYIENGKLSLFYNEEKLGLINPTIPSLNTFKGEQETLEVENEKISINSYVVPADEDYHLSGSNKKRADIYFKHQQMDGVYLYRNDRLIDFGKWYGIISDSYRSKNAKNVKRMRLIIDFDQRLDSKFGIEPTKSELVLPEIIKSEVYKCFEKLNKKLTSHLRKVEKKELITENENLWKLKNGKPTLNYESKILKEISKNENFISILKEIEKTIPMIITHNIRFNDLSISNGTLLNQAVNAVNAYSKQGHNLVDSIDLICSRKPFYFEDDLKNQLREYFNV